MRRLHLLTIPMVLALAFMVGCAARAKKNTAGTLADLHKVSPDVQDVKVLRSIPLLDAAAIEAVKQWQYTPTLLNGVPVPVIMTVTVNFTLR